MPGAVPGVSTWAAWPTLRARSFAGFPVGFGSSARAGGAFALGSGVGTTTALALSFVSLSSGFFPLSTGTGFFGPGGGTGFSAFVLTWDAAPGLISGGTSDMGTSAFGAGMSGFGRAGTVGADIPPTGTAITGLVGPVRSGRTGATAGAGPTNGDTSGSVTAVAAGTTGSGAGTSGSRAGTTGTGPGTVGSAGGTTGDGAGMTGPGAGSKCAAGRTGDGSGTGSTRGTGTTTGGTDGTDEAGGAGTGAAAADAFGAGVGSAMASRTAPRPATPTARTADPRTARRFVNRIIGSPPWYVCVIRDCGWKRPGPAGLSGTVPDSPAGPGGRVSPDSRPGGPLSSVSCLRTGRSG